jgi:adenylate cyclase
MTSHQVTRKLAAILSADVKGYSRLMGQDEEWTVHTLKSSKEVMKGLIGQHRGRVVDAPGDNLLAEFGSVVDAVQCAVEVQQVLKAKNAMLPENRKMEFRIGINLGDVIEEGDLIYGEGVNIAARIEGLAEAGGVCISESAYQQIENKLPLRYDYLGEHEVKNIAKPVRVYRAQIEPEPLPRKPIEGAKMAALPDKPSIVVLPFVNMSTDPEQEYFSDGMTEELISALAKIEGLKVISRTSAFHFKGTNADLRTIGENLKVEHVLEGSVRKAGNRLRITAQLIKVADDAHLWSESYNREIEDVFAIQEEISNAIVDKLKIQILGQAPIVKTRTENMAAYESFIRGRYCFYSATGKESMERALQYYERALTLDPKYAPAYSAIAEWYWGLPLMGGPAPSREDVYAKAKEAITKALDIDHDLPEAHSTLGLIRMVYEWDWKGAKEAFEAAVTLNPGSTKSHHDYAIYLASVVEDIPRSLSEARKAVELDPLSGNAHYVFGHMLFLSGQLDHALEELRHARETISHVPSISALVQTYTAKGMLEEAMDEINRGLRLFPKHPMLLGHMGNIYALRGEKRKAEAILDELIERSKKEYVSPLFIAFLCADLGEMDRMFEYLEKGYETCDTFFTYIKSFRQFHQLRTDPRFIAFWKKMGLEA